MNNDWIEFVQSNNAILTENLDIQFTDNKPESSDSITALFNLSLIQVTGNDAAQFLQGQLTCNTKEIDDSTSFFAAFCNAKGRTITTLLILKHNDSYLLILPECLIEKVITKLKMYILRADVQISNVSDLFCLTGLTTNNCTLFDSLPTADFAVINSSQIIIKLPSIIDRYILISDVNLAKSNWIQLTKNNEVSAVSSTLWDFQDISAGIPWLTENSSEEYIPQMLNIDKLGGISFNKGCYTGQEIVARTHYLGKSKRELFVVKCGNSIKSKKDLQLFLDNSEQFSGKILSLKSNGKNTKALLVMPTSEADLNKLKSSDSNQVNLSIIDFQ